MMVIEQDLFIPQAALPRRGYSYTPVAGRYTYRLGNFFQIRNGTAVTSAPLDPTDGDNQNTIAAARRSLREPSVRATAGFQLAIRGGTAQNVLYDAAGSAQRIRFEGDQFTILGDARDAVDAEGRTEILLISGFTAVTVEDRVIFPADRCTWVSEASIDGTGYAISEAIFYDGVTASGIALTSTSIPGGHVGTVRLGYIGKSGRFVPITDAN